MKIYVVTGSTGEYSDRVTWLVKAFTDEDSAKEFVIKAQEIADVIFKRSVEDDEEGWDIRDNAQSELDPGLRMYYTGTTYYFESVELESK